MLTATITNTSTLPIQPESVSQALGVYPPAPYLTLPGCLSWLQIAASASATPVVSVDDLEAYATTPGFGGMKVKDILQKMVQAGQITVSYVLLSADVDTYGKAVHAQ
jgi:hypothetical protein